MSGTDRRHARSPSVHVAPSPRVPRDPAEDAVLRLHAAAGNRAVTEALGPLPVQRAPKPRAGAANTGGELRIGTGKPIPFRTVTWSVSATTKTDQVGNQRRPTLIPGAVQVGEIVITREADDRSDALRDLFERQVTGGAGDDGDEVSIRLDRASTDGRLAATELALHRALPTALSVAHNEPEPAVERVAFSVESLGVKGKSGSAPRDPMGTLEIRPGGGDPWLPMPVLELDMTRPREAGSGKAGSRFGTRLRDAEAESTTRARAKVAAGPALEQLASGIQSQIPVTAVFRDRAGREEQLVDALFERLESTSDGPDVVTLGLVTVNARTTPPPRR